MHPIVINDSKYLSIAESSTCTSRFVDCPAKLWHWMMIQLQTEKPFYQSVKLLYM